VHPRLSTGYPANAQHPLDIKSPLTIIDRYECSRTSNLSTRAAEPPFLGIGRAARVRPIFFLGFVQFIVISHRSCRQSVLNDRWRRGYPEL
jgi:hypothetical protein